MKRLSILVIVVVALVGCATTDDTEALLEGYDGEPGELVIENLTDYPVTRGILEHSSGRRGRLNDPIDPEEQESISIVPGSVDVELTFDVAGMEVPFTAQVDVAPGTSDGTELSITPEDLAAAMAAAGIDPDALARAEAARRDGDSDGRERSAADSIGPDGSVDPRGIPMGTESTVSGRLPGDLAFAALRDQEPSEINRSDLPDHVRIFEAFEQFGLDFTQIPDELEDFLTELGLASAQDLDLVALVHSADGRELEAMTLSENPGEWDFSYTFPADGDYRLSVAARPKGTEGDFVPVAAIDVESIFPPDHQAFTYSEDEYWLRIVLRDIRDVNRPWEASAGQYDRYSTGIVVGDYTIINEVARVPVTDGSRVEFPQTEGDQIDIIGVELEQPLDVTTETEDFTFATGSKVILSETWVRGVINHSFTQRVGGTRVTFPEGCFVEISDGRLTALSSPERILLRHGTQLIPFEEAEFVDLEDDRVLRGVFVMSEERTIRVEDTRLDLPEGAVILTDGAGITQIYAEQTFPIYRNRTAVQVHPGEAVFFKSNGAFDEVRSR